MTWLQRASIGEGVAKGLNYLHTLRGQPLIHGDVKSANVLLDSQFEPKLGDFGLAKQLVASSQQGMYTHLTVTSVHGTSVYLPHEYLRSKKLSSAVDVYSYGIVMLEMATGRRAYDGKRLLIDLVDDEIEESGCSETEGPTRFMDLRLIDDSNGLIWFPSLIKLGRDCANRLKNKRPTMRFVLEYYQQFRTKDKIRKISVTPTACSPLARSPQDVELKTPLELQLWYDMVRKEAGNKLIPSTVCPTIGSSATGNSSTDCRLNMISLNKQSNNPADICEERNSSELVEPIIPLITELGIQSEESINSSECSISSNLDKTS